jgi:hypothetical protein
MRHGVKVSKLKYDVQLPADTLKFYDPSHSTAYSGRPYSWGEWGITRPYAAYQGHTTIRVDSGDWNVVPAASGDHIALQGSYVVSTAQKFGRFAAYQMEPKALDGLFMWNFADEVFGGGATYSRVSFDLSKSYSYSAIPADALLPLSLEEDQNNKPEYTFAPPYYSSPHPPLPLFYFFSSSSFSSTFFLPPRLITLLLLLIILSLLFLLLKCYKPLST